MKKDATRGGNMERAGIAETCVGREVVVVGDYQKDVVLFPETAIRKALP